MAAENNGNAERRRNGEDWLIRRFVQLKSAVDLNFPMTVFDVGANRGDYSLSWLDKASSAGMEIKLYLFEPLPRCNDILRERFGDRQNVHIMGAAASDQEGCAEIYSDTQDSALASLYERDLAEYGIEFGATESIRLLRLDNFLQQHRIDRIDFLKIDVEGHELAVFHGLGDFLNPGRIEMIQFEYGGANLDSKTSLRELYRLLEGNGFTLAKLLPRGIDSRRYQAWMENFQYANYLAVSPGLMRAMT